MTTMFQPSFDTLLAAAARERAVDCVQRSPWYGLALSAVQDVARARRSFTTDDVLAHAPSLERADELRVMGAAMRGAVSRGWCYPGGYVQSDRVKSHGRPKREWMSTLYGSGGD